MSESFETARILAHQAPLSMRFPRQEYWSGLPFPSPGDLPDPGLEPSFPALQAGSLPPSHLGSPSRVSPVLHVRTLRCNVRGEAQAKEDPAPSIPAARNEARKCYVPFQRVVGPWCPSLEARVRDATWDFILAETSLEF